MSMLASLRFVFIGVEQDVVNNVAAPFFLSDSFNQANQLAFDNDYHDFALK